MTDSERRGTAQESVTPTRHGGSIPVPPEALLDPDPDLRLVWADMDAWADAHPCECEALCECEEEA